MKRWMIWICFCLWIGGVPAEDDYRDFTDAQGRTIRGKITACDLQRNKVTVERADNRRRVTVGIADFSGEDQAYIKEWHIANEVLSKGKLRVVVKEQSVEKRKEEKYRNVSDTSGNVESKLMKITSFEKTGYEIAFQNSNSTALENLRLEYRIYYEQSKESWGEPKVEQKKLAASVDVASLPPKKKIAVSTKPVEVFEDSINTFNWDSGGSRTGGSGKVHGIRARLYMKLPSGKEAMREFCEPAALSGERFPW